MNVKSLKVAEDRLHCVDALLGKGSFADKVLKGGNVVNVITGEIYVADVAIYSDRKSVV